MSNIFNPKWSYCSNVFTLTSIDQWKKQISFFGKTIRKYIHKPTLGIGLWFSQSVLKFALTSPFFVQEMKDIFTTHQLDIFTMNAFPYGNFHEKVVKTKVYQPDWSTPQRLHYTENCANLLAQVTTHSKVTISTLPLGWTPFWTPQKNLLALENLCLLLFSLQKIEQNTGVHIQVCLEPEPGCVLEYTSQTISFWINQLLPFAKKKNILPSLVRYYLGVCYDTCHQSVQFENGQDSLERLQQHNIPIGKMQVSNALEFHADISQTTKKQRQSFIEEKFLHQTNILENDNSITSYSDLNLAINNFSTSWDRPWRTHYHLPLFLEDSLSKNKSPLLHTFKTTINETIKVVQYAINNQLCEHFEIETYTWTILPHPWCPRNDLDLAQNIAKEWLWIESCLK